MSAITQWQARACAPLTRIALPCALLMAVACNSPRDPVSLACTGNEHCPADGKWYCDVTQKKCVPCAAACPVTHIADKDIGSQDDGDATASDASYVSAATDTTDDPGETVTSVADAAAGCDVVLPVIAGTCVGHCFQWDLGADGSRVYGDGLSCSCHPWCKLGIAGVPACCSDYDAACGSCLDAANVSCGGRCGSRDTNKACQCDSDCEQKDDCCQDYGSACGKCVGGKNADGSCGDYDPAQPCQCDTQCVTNMDCCSDFKTLGCPEE